MMKTRAVKFDVEKVLDDKIIGTGYNTTVNSYLPNDEQDAWVAKCIEVDNIDKLLQIMEEIVLSFSCDHENFNSIKGYCVIPTDKTNFKVYLKLQLMRENISSLCNKKQGVPEQEIVKILHSLISGLEYLHRKGIAHQNLKPTNIFVSNNGDTKLADISSEGYADRRDRLNAQGDTSEIIYLPPEVLDDSLDQKELDLYKADIWSLGRCLLDLLLCSYEGDVLKEQEGQNEAIKKGFFLDVQKVYSSDLSSLLQDMLSSEPNQRRSAHEIKHIIETKLFAKNEPKSFENEKKYKSQSNDLNVNETEKKPWNLGE